MNEYDEMVETEQIENQFEDGEALDEYDRTSYDEDQMFSWNNELAEGSENLDLESIIVYSRDWTIETIISQIKAGNIDLNPSFQRRNAWNDKKRSLLIESLILNVPIPEIVLAEHPAKRRSFLVLDGKQRLLTLIGFFDSRVHPEI